ncbi:hypothetical protein JOC54_002721 [Alkalihalobacillus xiaoxiensis]|uniref:Uncharacterized protein n=1 Tax=Shouchella xiaoxiensis TaxID=766895 RepID=A0ABS2SWR2_9BACI|nr:hypothetical protein [Shouchella xiaoxiensis]MBM7839441.1 hypothetical protein [Shouchella xiaoxiensis]
MDIPKYWAESEIDTLDSTGKRVVTSVWRWSDVSEAEAQSHANKAAAALTSRIEQGEPLQNKYAYGHYPVREEIISSHDDLGYVITRNLYGSFILNSEDVMFVDIDFAQSSNASLLKGIKGLFSRKKKAASEGSNETEAINQLKRWVDGDAKRGATVYRTYGGLRYMMTHQTYDPSGQETEQILEELRCDPSYRVLCKVQNSFRARLTPKPWRFGMDRIPVRYPYRNEEERESLAKWDRNYKEKLEQWRTCEYVMTVGNKEVPPEIAPVQTMHDQATKAYEPFPLA